MLDKNRDFKVENFESSYILIHRLRELQKYLEAREGREREPSGTNDKSMSLPIRIRLEKEINAINQQFIPIFYADHIRRMASAREVIYENLRYRQIREKINPVLRTKK